MGDPRAGLVLASDYPSEEVMFNDLNNEEKRQRAYVLYMQETPPKDIAFELQMDLHVIRRWIVRDGWSTRLRALRQQRIEEEQIALEAFRGSNRLDEVMAQLRAGQSGRELVMKFLAEGSDDLSPGNLKQLADALKAFTDVAARAVGVGETVESKGGAEEQAAAGKIKPPPVVINVAPGASVTVSESR